MNTCRTHLFFILLLCGSITHAQEHANYIPYSRKHLISSIELVAGPALGFLRGNPGVDNNAVNNRAFKPGFTYGIGLNHRINEKLEGRLLLLAEKKGSVVNRKNLYFDMDSQTLKEGKTKEEFIYDYYSFPLLAAYSFDKKNNLQVSAGPFISYLRKQLVRTTHQPQGTVGIEDQTDFNKKIDFGCALSFSYRVAVNNRISLKAQVLNTLGLINTRSLSNYGVMRTNNTSLLLTIMSTKALTI